MILFFWKWLGVIENQSLFEDKNFNLKLSVIRLKFFGKNIVFKELSLDVHTYFQKNEIKFQGAYFFTILG